jgi:hypothetical protein
MDHRGLQLIAAAEPLTEKQIWISDHGANRHARPARLQLNNVALLKGCM